jgi:hypothetical protein
MLNPNSWSLLFSPAETNWHIIDRSPNQTFDTISITAATGYDASYNYLNAYLPLNPNTSTGRNVTIPNPTENFSRNKWMKIENVSSSFALTLVSASNFSGKYGSGNTSLTVPINTWVEMYSNGTNWLVQNRSVENQFYYPAAFGSDGSIAANFQFINAELHLTSTLTNNNVTVIIPTVGVSQTINQKYIIYNDNGVTNTNSYNIILSSTSSFKGSFLATDGTTYTLSPNSKVELYNNGSNWVVSDFGDTGNQSLPIQSSSGTFSITRPFTKYNLINKMDSSVFQLITLPPPLRGDVGREIVIRYGIRATNGGIVLTASGAQAIYTPTAVATTDFQTGLSSIRLTVLQYGYAGSGTVSMILGTGTQKITCNVTMTTGFLSLLSVLTLSDAPLASIQLSSSNAPGNTGTGKSGVYNTFSQYLSMPADVVYNFTCTDVFAWTMC